MDFQTIKSTLPQDIPFLMVDKVLHRVYRQEIVCLKNISGNDWVFLGHFPKRSVFPGVLIIEAMAQSSILLFTEPEATEERLYYLTSTKVRFLHPVMPGDQLKITISVIRDSSIGAIVKAEAEVEEKVVAKGELSFAVQ
ncbi:3-hydroxyacyl-ACP dehydratase FabZ [Laceyella putida]|uniref:3-hydroxyacyl-ACP dehydratase FabZ n=1 Tax=Laceyella putida TaxID=110101 RepID=A0ABW2RHL8_9BACL